MPACRVGHEEAGTTYPQTQQSACCACRTAAVRHAKNRSNPIELLTTTQSRVHERGEETPSSRVPNPQMHLPLCVCAAAAQRPPGTLFPEQDTSRRRPVPRTPFSSPTYSYPARNNSTIALPLATASPAQLAHQVSCPPPSDICRCNRVNSALRRAWAASPKREENVGLLASLFYPMGLASRPIKLLRFADDFLLFFLLSAAARHSRRAAHP